MLVGAVMGFWTVQRVHASARHRARGRDPRRRARGRGDGVDPRLPRDHAAREPDRLGPRADDLRRRGRPVVLPRQRPQPLRRRRRTHTFHAVFPASMQHWPIVGPIVFGQDVLVYVSWACVIAIWLYLSRTRPGLNVRAVGESPAAADTMGINVTALPLRPHARRRRVRRRRRRDVHARDHAAVGRTGSPAARAGSRSRSSSSRSGGRSSASSARTSSARCRRSRPQLQARHISLGPTVLWTNALPYVMTIVVLVVVSSGTARSRLGAPAALGNAYAREER